jgi:hypothetical protein
MDRILVAMDATEGWFLGGHELTAPQHWPYLLKAEYQERHALPI